MNKLAAISSPALPALAAMAGEPASICFLQFFAANIRDPHTRWAYLSATQALSECGRSRTRITKIGRQKGMHFILGIGSGGPIVFEPVAVNLPPRL